MLAVPTFFSDSWSTAQGLDWEGSSGIIDFWLLLFLIFTALRLWDGMEGREGGGNNKGSSPPLDFGCFCLYIILDPTNFLLRQSNLSRANK